MLRIVIELHPFGDSSKKKDIGEIFIANMGYGSIHVDDGTYCIYNVWRERPTPETIDNPIVKLEHRREDGAETLVRKVLNELEKK